MATSHSLGPIAIGGINETPNVLIWTSLSNPPTANAQTLNQNHLEERPVAVGHFCFTNNGNIYRCTNASNQAALVWEAMVSTTSLPRQTVRLTAVDTTAVSTDQVIVATSTATITLPAATGSGQTYRIKSRSGTTTIDGNGAETVNGAATQELTAGQSVTITDTAVGIWE
jgi:hypothetical protein